MKRARIWKPIALVLSFALVGIAGYVIGDVRFAVRVDTPVYVNGQRNWHTPVWMTKSIAWICRSAGQFYLSPAGTGHVYWIEGRGLFDIGGTLYDFRGTKLLSSPGVEPMATWKPDVKLETEGFSFTDIYGIRIYIAYPPENPWEYGYFR